MKYKTDEEDNIILDDGTVIKKEERQLAEVYSRVVGYLRPVSQYNKGKQSEFKKRKMFKPK